MIIFTIIVISDHVGYCKIQIVRQVRCCVLLCKWIGIFVCVQKLGISNQKLKTWYRMIITADVADRFILSMPEKRTTVFYSLLL